MNSSFYEYLYYDYKWNVKDTTTIVVSVDFQNYTYILHNGHDRNMWTEKKDIACIKKVLKRNLLAYMEGCGIAIYGKGFRQVYGLESIYDSINVLTYSFNADRLTFNDLFSLKEIDNGFYISENVWIKIFRIRK